MRKRSFAGYGTVAAVTVAAAAVLAACEPADMSMSKTDFGAALDWSQPERGTPGGAHDPMPAEASGHSGPST